MGLFWHFKMPGLRLSKHLLVDLGRFNVVFRCHFVSRFFWGFPFMLGSFKLVGFDHKGAIRLEAQVGDYYLIFIFLFLWEYRKVFWVEIYQVKSSNVLEFGVGVELQLQSFFEFFEILRFFDMRKIWEFEGFYKEILLFFVMLGELEVVEVSSTVYKSTVSMFKTIIKSYCH